MSKSQGLELGLELGARAGGSAGESQIGLEHRLYKAKANSKSSQRNTDSTFRVQGLEL